MPGVAWRTTTSEHATAHLVVGLVPDGSVTNQRMALLTRFARALKPAGRYAVGGTRERHAGYAHIAFELQDGADKLANVVKATSALIPYRGWTSQRTFVFGDSAVAAIEQAISQTRPGLPETLLASGWNRISCRSEANGNSDSEEKRLVLAQEASGQQIEVERRIFGCVSETSLNTAYSWYPAKSFNHQREIPTTAASSDWRSARSP